LAVLPQFSLTTGDQDAYARLVTALNANDLSTLEASLAALNYPLGTGAAIQASGVQWTIADTSANYVAWVQIDGSGNPVLHAGPDNAALAAAFRDHSYTLQPLATIEKDDESGWFVDNDSSNPDDRQAGDVKLQVLDLSPRSPDVYGTTIRIKRSLADGTLEFDDADCEATTLSAANLGPDTVCPNGHTFQTNQASGTTTWNDWMRGTFTGDIARGRTRTSLGGNPGGAPPGPPGG